jgi:hypothetical protein
MAMKSSQPNQSHWLSLQLFQILSWRASIKLGQVKGNVDMISVTIIKKQIHKICQFNDFYSKKYLDPQKQNEIL